MIADPALVLALDHPTHQELSRRFVELRVAAGLDVETLAERAGIEPQIMLEFEAGSRTWTMREIEAVADALDVRLATVFAAWDVPSPS